MSENNEGEEWRRRLDYFFLIAGLALVVFLFVPAPVIFLDRHLHFGQASGGILEDVLFGTIPIYLLAIIFALTHYAFIRQLIDGFIELGYNATIAGAVLLCFLLAFFVLGMIFSFGIALFAYDVYLGLAVSFLAFYYIISSVRDLNKLDRIDF